LPLVATCALGLEEILAGELTALGACEVTVERGAVTFVGGWTDCYRANWRLRTANRVLVELATWEAADAAALAAGARAAVSLRGGAALDVGALLHPDRSFALKATATGTDVGSVRWALLSVKDGLVDGQRDRYGRRSDVDRVRPDLSLRLRVSGRRAALLLDTSGEPLDRRGYRAVTTTAPVREQLAAACVIAAGWDGVGPVVDPMCGSGTLLIEAGWIALGLAPGHLRSAWAFERLPFFRAADFAAVRAEPIKAPGPDVRLFGNDRSAEALAAARANLARAGLADRAELRRGDAADLVVPPGPGLVLVNPPHGGRVATDPDAWRALGDLLKQRFKGWRAVVLAGGPDLGKHLGLRPKRRLPVMNGPLPGRILLLDLY
jgi:putative N6-adenine-specific DNA methylase